MIWTNHLLAHPSYQANLKELESLEENRIYCRHDLEHFLAVARIARILSLERGFTWRADDIYLTALLHDIGRIDEYRCGIPHEIAGGKRAKALLDAIGYPTEKGDKIISVIQGHRGTPQGNDSFTALFQEADRLSRPCIFCTTRDTCHWPDEKKNLQLRY